MLRASVTPRLPVPSALIHAAILLITIPAGSYAEETLLDAVVDHRNAHVPHGNGIIASRQRDIETFVELVEGAGYVAEEHDVTTEDGYILSIHRIPGGPKSPVSRGKQPIILIHGLFAASDIWVLRGPEHDLGKVVIKSCARRAGAVESNKIAYQLVDHGYDVWALNSRGNYYGKRHKYLSTSEPSFWRFSWHEFGTYDTAASIDYILSVTGMPRVSLVGHSMGGTVELVLLSTRPEYNERVNVALTFAPVVLFTHALRGPIVRFGMRYGKQIEEALRLLNRFELFPRDEMDLSSYVLFCQRLSIQPFCQKIACCLFGLANCEAIDAWMLPRLVKHYPQGTSVETLQHYRQIAMSGKFQQYDFGPTSNYLRYKSFSSPEYPLENITAPVVLYYGPNDPYTTKKDVQAVQMKIPSATSREIPHSNFGHLDFLFLNETKKLLYDDAIELLNEHRDAESNGLQSDAFS